MDIPAHTEKYHEIGQRLRRARLRLNLSQEELAREIDTTSVSISRWERGIVLPQPLYRTRLCQIFALNAALLFEEQGSQLDQLRQMSLWHVPYLRNPLFTGRAEMLQRLCDVLHTEHAHPQAICGLGGVGKTQLALEYAYRYQQEYQAIFWLSSETRETLLSDVVLIAQLLNLPVHTDSDQQRIVEAVKRWLSEHPNWLCIFDNVEDFALITAFIPTRQQGHILLTTRMQATGILARRLDLTPMAQDEGAWLLLRRAKLVEDQATLDTVSEEQRTLAQTIAHLLDGLPLALDQVGAYIEETGCTLANYLSYFQERQATLLSLRGQESTHHPQSVTATFTLSYEKIEQAHSHAADLLKFCAFLQPDAIPEELCIDLYTVVPHASPSISTIHALELETALATLRLYSLIKRNVEAKTLTIHRVVQTVLRDTMEQYTQSTWVQRVITLLNQHLPQLSGQKVWPIYQRYLPHAEICAMFCKQWKLASSDAGKLFSLMGAYLIERAQYSSAEGFLFQALDVYQQMKEQGQHGLATVYRYLSELYFYTGEYLQALPYAQKALAIFQQTSEGEHAEMATCLHNVAALYQARGEYAQAERLYQQALEMRQRILGPMHADVAEALNNFAALYSFQEKYQQAEPLFQRALAIYEQTLGPEDPLVARGLNNLALTYSCMGKPELAETTYLRALSLYEQTLDPEHPLIAFVFHNLAIHYYREQQKQEQIEPLLLKARAIREKVLGADHPDLGSTLYWLALYYSSQHQNTQAQPLFERALTIREQALGLLHPRTIECLLRLADLYEQQDNLEQAEKLYRQMVITHQQAPGEIPPKFTKTLQQLEALFVRTGHLSETEMLRERSD